MAGKSATGNSGKVPYYEHNWATKRDATLSKKLFHCEPHRVPARRLEPLIREKFRVLVTEEKFMKAVFEKVKAHHAENPHRKDEERLKAKIFGINSQIEGLAERLAELPKSVSAAPIYKQMERLEAIKKEHEDGLEGLKATGKTSLDRIVNLNVFEDFASHFRKFVTQAATPAEEKQMLAKFIHRIEIGTEAVKIHWIVDQDHYDRELAQARAGSRPLKGQVSLSLAGNFANFGSHTLTNGATGRN